MAKKIFLVLMLLGIVTIPLFSNTAGFPIGPTTIIFSLSLFFLGVHCSNNAKKIAGGNSKLFLFYKATPILLPIFAIVTSIFFKAT